MSRLVRLILMGVAVALCVAAPAVALPANPWAGTWQTNDGSLVTMTQTGTQLSGTQPCPGTTSLPGITFTGTASADSKTAQLAYSSAVCTGVGGTFTATLATDARSLSGSGVTQYGTGFSLSWTYQGGGTEPRIVPTPPAACAGGPWSGRWSARGSSVFSFLQTGDRLFGTLEDEAETIQGTVAGNQVDATFRTPGRHRHVRADAGGRRQVVHGHRDDHLGRAVRSADLDVPGVLQGPGGGRSGHHHPQAPDPDRRPHHDRRAGDRVAGLAHALQVRPGEGRQLATGPGARLDLQRPAEHPSLRAEARRLHPGGIAAGLHPGPLPRAHVRPAHAAERGPRIRPRRDAAPRRDQAAAGHPPDHSWSPSPSLAVRTA